MPKPASAKPRRAQTLPQQLVSFLPREHGFWVMLSVVVLAAVLQNSPNTSTVLTAVWVFVAFTFVGGLTRRSIRRHGTLQLASAALLSLAGAPIEFVAGVSTSSLLANTLAWAGVFVGSALVVRSVFARAKRGGAVRARALEFCAIALPFFVGVLLGGFSFEACMWAGFIAALGCGGLILSRPTVRQMKPIGLTLSAIAILSGTALVIL